MEVLKNLFSYERKPKFEIPTTGLPKLYICEEFWCVSYKLALTRLQLDSQDSK